MPILSKLRRVFFVFLLGVTAARCADDKASDLESLIQTERNFSQASVEHGIRDSFLQFFADECVVFTSKPMRGKEVYSAYQGKGEQLNWEPIFAAISAAGDLGCTTGPWSIKNSAADAKPAAFGQFMSIWKRQADSSWKVILDFGIDHPSPTVPPKEPELLPPQSDRQQPGTNAVSQLTASQKRLYDGLADVDANALLSLAHERIRVLRSGQQPAVGKEAANRLLSSKHFRSQRQQILEDISRSKDLAYEYGSYSGRFGDTVRGYFVSVWRSDDLGNWKLLVDVEKPVPNDSGN